MKIDSLFKIHNKGLATKPWGSSIVNFSLDETDDFPLGNDFDSRLRILKTMELKIGVEFHLDARHDVRAREECEKRARKAIKSVIYGEVLELLKEIIWLVHEEDKHKALEKLYYLEGGLTD